MSEWNVYLLGACDQRRKCTATFFKEPMAIAHVMQFICSLKDVEWCIGGALKYRDMGRMEIIDSDGNVITQADVERMFTDFGEPGAEQLMAMQLGMIN
jgi:hypothetical protein